jgi:hypothetical protein
MQAPRNLSDGQSGLPPQAGRRRDLRRIALPPFFEFPLPPLQGLELLGNDPLGFGLGASPAQLAGMGTASGPHRSVIAASASLLVGSESVGKSVSTVEHAALVVREAAAFQGALVASLGASRAAFRLVWASNLLALGAAQRRGLAESLLIMIDSQAGLDRAIGFLGDHLRNGPVGVGLDVATTSRSSSRPSSLTVTEKRGHDHVQVLVALWKERRQRLRQGSGVGVFGAGSN